MNVPSTNVSFPPQDQPTARQQSANLKISSTDNNGSYFQFHSQSPPNQYNIEKDSIKQLFKKPTQTIIKNMNQRRIGLDEQNMYSSKNSGQFKRSRQSNKVDCIDYAIEIEQNNVTPSLDSPFLQQILQKHPRTRSMQELYFVKECLYKLDIFKYWNESQLSSQSESQNKGLSETEHKWQSLLIYKHLIYKTFKMHAVIFFQGDLPRECYTIIKGEILVLQAENCKKERKIETQICQLMNEYQLNREEYDTIMQLHPNNTIIARIKQGHLFGEMGIQFKEGRTATAISLSEELCVGCLDQKSFKATLQDQYCRQNENIMDFLRGVCLFKGIEDNQLNLLALSCEIISRKINTIIYKENDAIDYVYFVMSGEIEISQSIESINNVNIIKHRSSPYSSNYLDNANQKSNSQDQVYDTEQMISDVKEAILLNKYYKPQTDRIKIGGRSSSTSSSSPSSSQPNIKELQQLAEERQYSYLSSKKKIINYTSFIVGKNELFGDQIRNYGKRNNSAKVISSYAQLVRIKSQQFFDIIENSFTKAYPDIDLVKTLSIKNRSLEQHRERKLIGRQQLFETLEKEKEKQKQNNLYRNYEDILSTTSITTVLENIKNDNSEQNNDSQQQILQKQISSPTFSQTSSTQCLFRTRKLTNSAQADDNSLTMKNSPKNSSSNNNKGNQSNKAYNSPSNSNLREEQNIIRGQTFKRVSLSTFSNAFFASSSPSSSANNNNNNSNSHQQNNSIQDNSIATPTQITSFSNAGANFTNFFSAPNSAKGIDRVSYRSQYHASRQSLSIIKTNTNGLLNKSDQKEKHSFIKKPFGQESKSRQQNRSFNENQIATGSQSINTNEIQNQKQNQRSMSNPHSKTIDRISKQRDNQTIDYVCKQNNQDVLSKQSNQTSDLLSKQISYTLDKVYQQKSSSIDYTTSTTQIKQSSSIDRITKQHKIILKQNTIFDILYPDLVTQVNRQIGVIKSMQSVKNAEVRQNFQHKPSVETIKVVHQTNKIASNPPSPIGKKLKLSSNMINSPIEPQSPSRIKGGGEEDHKFIYSQQIIQDQSNNKEINFNDQMCITYKHLNLHKIFPQSSHSTQAKQYFSGMEKEFKAKMDFEKKYIKQKNLQVPYMQLIEQKINQMKYDISKESFNFISKKNSCS